MENTKQLEAFKSADRSVLKVIGSATLQGFEKAHVVSTAISELKNLLTPEYMKPIMELQGNKLGFKTDQDKKGGYPVETVKNCLIEAVLFGLQPTGNQFNIIAGNMYPTKEGCGALLNNKDVFPNLKKTISVGLPRINQEKTSAAFSVQIKWELNGNKREETIDIPIKLDAYTSVDAMVGKATRKARAWLLSELLETEITDGEVEDVNYKVVSSTPIIDANDLQFLFETSKHLLSEAEQKRGAEILKTQEVNSYKKLYAALQSAIQISNEK